MPSEHDRIGQPPRGSLVWVFCGTGAVFITFLLPHVRMRRPNPNCNRLRSPNRDGHTAHVVSDNTNAPGICDDINFCSYCGTPVPATHRSGHLLTRGKSHVPDPPLKHRRSHAIFLLKSTSELL